MESQQKKNIIKSGNGRWSDSEHNKFMKGLEKYGKDWEAISKFIKSRNVTQIRSHAQKMFIKMKKQDIDALIQKENSQEDSTEIQIIKNRTSKKRSRLPNQGTLLDSFKKCIVQETEEISSEPAYFQQSLLQKNSKIILENSEETSLFSKIIRENQEHFLKGGNFLDLSGRKQNKLEFQIFYPQIHDSKETPSR